MEKTLMVRTFSLLAPMALLLAAGMLAGQTNERRVTRLADGVYAIEHKNLNDGNTSGNTTVISNYWRARGLRGRLLLSPLVGAGRYCTDSRVDEQARSLFAQYSLSQ